MPDLSPAAQAVMAAMIRSYDHEETRKALAAAALRAAADQVTDNIPILGSGKSAQGVEDSAAYLEAIATELETDR